MAPPAAKGGGSDLEAGGGGGLLAKGEVGSSSSSSSSKRDDALSHLPGQLSATLAAVVKASTRIIGMRATSTSDQGTGGHHSSQGRAARDSSSASTAQGGAERTSSSAASTKAPGKQQLTEEEKSFWSSRKLKLSADATTIWALGIVIVIGGQYFGWNISTLTAGFGSFFIASMLMSSGYVVLCFSLAEMTSAMPFSGGAYGYARVTQGTYMGYLVGCCEMLQYIAYVAAAVISLGQIITLMSGMDARWEPLWWAVFFVFSLAIYIEGGTKFWRFTLYAALVMMATSIIYIVGSTPAVNFPKYHNNWSAGSDVGPNPYFIGGVSAFMKALPTTAWFYVGCETLALASEETFKPKRNVPLGLITCVLTLLATCLGTIFTTIGQAPGIEGISQTLIVYNAGYARMFHITEKAATAFSLPSAFGTAFGFIFCYSRQMFAMARSGLIPMGLSLTTTKNGSPYVALIVGSVLAYLIALAGWYLPQVAGSIFQVCIAMAFAVYIVQAISYLILFKAYPNIKRSFFSPFRLAGAWWCILVFGASLIGSLAFQSNALLVVGTVCVWVAVCSLYYWCISRHSQVISPEEEAVMFIAYVIKQNQKRSARNNMKKLKRDKTMVGAAKRFLSGDLSVFTSNNRQPGAASSTGSSKAPMSARGAQPDDADLAARRKEIEERKAQKKAAEAKRAQLEAMVVNDGAATAKPQPQPPQPSSTAAAAGGGAPPVPSLLIPLDDDDDEEKRRRKQPDDTTTTTTTGGANNKRASVTEGGGSSDNPMSALLEEERRQQQQVVVAGMDQSPRVVVEAAGGGGGGQGAAAAGGVDDSSNPASPFFMSPRSPHPSNYGGGRGSSSVRGRGISGERAAAIQARFGFVGVLLIALYNLLVCACARYQVELVGELPRAEDLARLEEQGDEEGIKELLRGTIKIKQDRGEVNQFFKKILHKAKVLPNNNNNNNNNNTEAAGGGGGKK